MPQLLAIEWDAREIRMVLATKRGKATIVDEAFAIPLPARDNESAPTIDCISQLVTEALAARKLSRIVTLVAVGRASIELQQLTMPPSPPEDLPEMVRFQALREFNTIGEDWPLDFMPMATNEDGTLEVLAATVSPEFVQQIKKTCESAKLTASHLILRPFAAASLLKRHGSPESTQCRLMIDLLAEEADLTVLDGDLVRLIRTVRVPVVDDNATQARALLGEIRRTIAAAHNQLRDKRISQIVLCGDGSDQESLKSLVEQELKLPIFLFDPFDGLQVSASLGKQHPEHAGRFAPLLGMVIDEAEGESTNVIDFLNPRRRPIPPNTRRRNLFIGATVAAACFGLFMLCMIELSALDEQIMRTKAKATSLRNKVAEAEKIQKDKLALDEFVSGDIHWLDELTRLSTELPSADEIIVTQLRMSSRPTTGGQIRVEGFARDSQQLPLVEQLLRGPGRSVVSSGGQDDPRRDSFRWRFDNTVIIDSQESSESTTATASVDGGAKR